MEHNTTQESSLSINKYAIETLHSSPKRLSMLIWGKAGCGKTTLAATAPGKKLWLEFDPDGTDSILDFPNIVKLSLAKESDRIVTEFKNENTMFMKSFIKILEENPDIETVVFDSTTSFGEKALNYGVVDAATTAKGKNSTIEDPGFAGYGRKNVWTLQAVKTLLQITARLNRHIIFISHEDVPDKNDQGHVIQITMLLGSSLSEIVPIQISEVWALTDTGSERRIAVRPVRLRTPMKTRMFMVDKQAEFTWKFDLKTLTGDTLAGWYNEWVKTGKKLQLPK